MATNMTHNDRTDEPMRVQTRTNFADVMSYLHGINISREDKVSIGHQLLYEAKNENLTRALIRLDHLSTLVYDWDGYGAAPVSKSVINNLKKVITISNDADWSHWNISPEANGALCLQSTNRIASISIGSDEFSYYSSSSDKEKSEDNIPFSPKKLLSVMRKIA